MKDLVNDGFRNVVKPYIDREDKKSREIIAPVEVSPAESAHSIGDQIVYNGILYDVTAAIAIGDALATSGAGENISEADDITTQLKNHTVTTDATPTQGSTNPVQSGGVYTSEQNIFAVMGANGAKNLLPNNAISQTLNGVTFTVNSDGTVTANGTATADARLDIYTNTDGSPDLVGKTVKLTGCPSGGGSGTYRIHIFRAESTDGSSGTPEDTGNGATFTWRNDGSGTKAVARVIVTSGQTVSNLVFKPMIRLASDTDDTYQPFAETNQELTKNKVSWDDYSKIGSVNILENDATTQTTSGITFTRNADGSITCSGTATANITYNIKTQPKMEDGKKYLLKSFQSGSSANAYLSYSDIQSADFGDYDGNGVIITKFDYSTYPNSKVRLRILSGTSFETPMTFYPLLTPILDYSGPYAPHAMTNRELTEINTTKDLTAQITNLNQKMTSSTYFLVKYGNVCSLRLYVGDSADVAAWTEALFTIPSDCKPKNDIYIADITAQKSILIRAASGDVNVTQGSETLHAAQFFCTWVVL